MEDRGGGDANLGPLAGVRVLDFTWLGAGAKILDGVTIGANAIIGAGAVVREPVPGDWTMLEQSARHTKAAAGTAEWKIAVPAEGSTTLKYRVLVRY